MADMDKQHGALGVRRSSGQEMGKQYGLAVVKGAIGAVPYAGTLLNEVLFEARSQLKLARVEEFFKGLSAKVAQLEEEQIDKSYIQSEEFSDFLEDVLVQVARTRDEQKRRRFQLVLVAAMKGHRQPDFSTLFLSILQEITEGVLRDLGGDHVRVGQVGGVLQRLVLQPEDVERHLVPSE